MASGVRVEGQLMKLKPINAHRGDLEEHVVQRDPRRGQKPHDKKDGRGDLHPVLKLKRVRIDGIMLGRLKPGDYRLIDPHRLGEAKDAALKGEFNVKGMLCLRKAYGPGIF